MPQVDEKQRQFASSVEDNIRNEIGKDIKNKQDKPADTDEPAEPKTPAPEKKVETDQKKSDTKPDDSTDTGDDETDLYEAIVSKVITDEFGGDESKIDEAKGIANLAIKTFGGDPIKAAKSYKNLFDQAHSMKTVVKKNPFIEKLITEASQGKTIDENYVKSVLGTATSADEPTDNKKQTKQDQLDDINIDDFDPDKVSADDLIESGVLDKTKYDTATSIDKRDMLEKARLRYAYKVLPVKIAERSAKLSKEKEAELTKQEQINRAKETNKTRILNSQRDFVTKYNVDFDGNPEHVKLYDEIFNKAVRLPDIDDDSGMLIAENSFEQAAKHVFQKHGVELGQPAITPEKQKETDPVKKVTSNTADIMRRILTGTNGFKGTASKRQQQQQRQQNTGNDLNSRVNDRINTELNRGYSTTKMISGIRKTDRKKS